MNPYSATIYKPMNHSRPIKVTPPTREPYISQLQTIPENDSLALFNFFYSYVSYIFNMPQFLQNPNVDNNDAVKMHQNVHSITNALVKDTQLYGDSKQNLYRFYENSDDNEDKTKLTILQLIDVIKSGGDIESPYGKPAGQPSDK